MEPDIAPFVFWLDAFRELSSCRVNGMGLGPIPFTSIIEYARIFKVDDFEEFLYIIRRMDDAVLEIEAAKAKGKGNASDKPSTTYRNKG